MSIAERVRREVRESGLVTVFFLSWFLFFLSLKKLVLTEYQIGVGVVGTAVIGARRRQGRRPPRQDPGGDRFPLELRRPARALAIDHLHCSRLPLHACRAAVPRLPGARSLDRRHFRSLGHPRRPPRPGHDALDRPCVRRVQRRHRDRSSAGRGRIAPALLLAARLKSTAIVRTAKLVEQRSDLAIADVRHPDVVCAGHHRSRRATSVARPLSGSRVERSAA